MCLVQRVGLILIGLHQRLDVEAGHVEDTHVREGLLHLVAPQPDVLDDRHDAAEQVRAELDHQRRRVDPLGTRLDVEAEGLENLLAAEPVAHQVAGVHDELFTLVPLGFGQRGVVVLQRDSAEGDVPGLVLHDVGQQLLGQRVLRRHVTQHPEGGECEPFDEDLHAEVGHVPARVAQGVVQQCGQVLVDRVDQADLLLQEPRERLDVPGLVHGLGGRVELRVQVRDDLDDLGRAHHRPLLAVQELRELPGLGVLAHLGAT